MNRKILKQLFVNPDLRRRFLTVLLFMFLFRVLAHIPVPVGDPQRLILFLETLFDSNRLLAFVDLFSGGALTNFSIISVGLSAYITASIVMQLLVFLIPALKETQKEGESGRQKINQYTRLLSVPFAIGQSIATIFLIKRLAVQVGQTDIIGDPTITQWALMITALTGGSLLLMWIGELISEKGIGNGISLLIFAGIVAQLPSLGGQYFSLIQSGQGQITTLLLFLAAGLLTIYCIVKLNEGQRTLTVSYAKRVRGSRAYGGVESILPIRVLTAGVVPIIFAVAILAVPTFFAQLFSGAQSVWLASLAANLTLWFDPQHTVYSVVYFLLVVAFTYFYTGVVFNAKEIAENIQKQGGFIAGIRPGAQTAKYLRKILNRITLFGALSLGLIAILPFIGERITGSSFLTFGGTGLLIVVSVAIETLRQLESQVITSSYS
jgi:preprotein translocase subunit SecY